MCILLCAFLISPNSHAFNKTKKLPLKKSENGDFYVNSTTDPTWSYTCNDGVEVELLSVGLNNNVPASIDFPDLESLFRIVVEIVYKGNNPGETIDIEDADGNIYTANREIPSGGSSSVWYYRAEIPVTSSITYSNTLYADKAQSMLAYVFRKKNNGLGSSGVFTAIGGYNSIEMIKIPIVTDSGPRSVSVELPVSELTDDGRYIHIEVSAEDGSFAELTETINDFPSGNCCIKVFTLNLENVAGSVNEIEIKIDTRNKKNGQNVNGQSWVMGGAVKTDVKCSCVDFDTTPPTSSNFTDHIILPHISLMPKITFSDECSAVTVEYAEYPAEESCWIDFGPEYTESNIWFHSFPFDKWHHWENGYLQKFLDGSAKIHGRVVNNTDPTSGWMIEIFFESLVDYSTWVSTGGYTENDAMQEQRMYANVDFNKSYTFTGFGNYTDSNVILLNNTNLHHMDIGPRNEYGDYGMGFWISYEGTVNGEVVGGESLQHIDMYSSLDKCVPRREILLIREWTVTDAAGNSQVFIQRVELEEEE